MLSRNTSIVEALNSNGEKAIRVINDPECIFSPFEPPKDTDAITVEYPSGAVEIYRYRMGGVAGVILASVTVTYLTAAKKDITTVEVV